MSEPKTKRPRVGGKQSNDMYEALFRALAHPTRRRILIMLNFEGGSMTAGDIADLFDHSWPTTTRHMRVLESALLIRQQRKGRTRVYHLDSHRLKIAHEWIGWFFKPPTTGGDVG